MEMESKSDYEERKAMRRQGGGLGLTPFSLFTYTAAWEQNANALPAYQRYQKPLQNPATGALRFMLNLDPLDGGAPIT